MRLDAIIATVTDHLLGRLLRRALVVVVMGACAIVAFYHFTIAGNIVLTGHVGDLNARLIIGAVYAAIALISLGVLWAMRGKSANFNDTPALNSPRERQIVTLVEAVMLGYSLARKGARTR